jgi:histidinol-phosphate aminotransferase
MYRIAAQTQGAAIVSVNRKTGDGFRLVKQGVLDALQADARIKLVFLTSPNNPTGDLVGEGFLRQLLEACRGRAIIVLDEAYAEFSAQHSASVLIAEYENFAVLRTLSKAWASAGLRCGAVLASPALLSLLRRVIAPYPIPSPVLELAVRMLGDDMLEKQRELLQEIADNKRHLLQILQNRGFIRKVIPGMANFVLIHVDDASGLLNFCARQGVMIRGFPSDPLLRNHLRISVGSESELDQFASVLDAWEKTQ